VAVASRASICCGAAITRPGRARLRALAARLVANRAEYQAGDDLPARGAAADSWSRQEEDLCDQDAAEVLLPRLAFIAACPARPDMDDVLKLAGVFEASAEATALRVVALSAIPAAMIVLEPSLKPAELTRIARRRSQPALPGFPPEDPIAPRLRVQKSLGHRTRVSASGTVIIL
jgi:hypothetical protein